MDNRVINIEQLHDEEWIAELAFIYGYDWSLE